MLIPFETGEQAIKLLGVDKIRIDQRARIGVRGYVLFEVRFMLDHIVDQAAQKRNVAAGTNAHVLIG
jgi:hypothetical protein